MSYRLIGRPFLLLGGELKELACGQEEVQVRPLRRRARLLHHQMHVPVRPAVHDAHACSEHKYAGIAMVKTEAEVGAEAKKPHRPEYSQRGRRRSRRPRRRSTRPGASSPSARRSLRRTTTGQSAADRR